MTAVVRCAGLTRRYVRRGAPPVVAVSDVTFRVDAGEVVTVQGPSGSGKTTLLGLIAGLEQPDEGSVEVLGRDIGRLTAGVRSLLRRSGVGVVFQSFGLVPSLDAGANVGLPLLLSGVGEPERGSRAGRALAEVGLADRFHARIDELSGGERQRVGIARAIVIEPALILADEPTGSLDDENATLALDLLVERCRALGSALVLVTHDPVSAARGDRRFRMRDGRLTEVAA